MQLTTRLEIVEPKARVDEVGLARRAICPIIRKASDSLLYVQHMPYQQLTKWVISLGRLSKRLRVRSRHILVPKHLASKNRLQLGSTS